jgi:hypothetical protein
MKKNDHYVSLSFYTHIEISIRTLSNPSQFPMSEYVKDPTTPSGWRTISYETQVGVAPDAVNLNPDAMDEGAEQGGSDIEPDMA